MSTAVSPRIGLLYSLRTRHRPLRHQPWAVPCMESSVRVHASQMRQYQKWHQPDPADVGSREMQQCRYDPAQKRICNADANASPNPDTASSTAASRLAFRRSKDRSAFSKSRAEMSSMGPSRNFASERLAVKESAAHGTMPLSGSKWGPVSRNPSASPPSPHDNSFAVQLWPVISLWILPGVS